MPRRLRRGIIFLMRSRIASNVSLIKKLYSIYNAARCALHPLLGCVAHRV